MKNRIQLIATTERQLLAMNNLLSVGLKAIRLGLRLDPENEQLYRIFKQLFSLQSLISLAETYLELLNKAQFQEDVYEMIG